MGTTDHGPSQVTFTREPKIPRDGKPLSSREVRDLVAMGINPETLDWLAHEPPEEREYWEARVHLHDEK